MNTAAATKIIETAQDKALVIWGEMTPMERYAVMQAVGECKSITKRLRLCIAHIASRLPLTA